MIDAVRDEPSTGCAGMEMELLEAIPVTDFVPSVEELIRFVPRAAGCAYVVLGDGSLRYGYAFSPSLGSRLPQGIELRPWTLRTPSGGRWCELLVARRGPLPGPLGNKRRPGPLRPAGINPDPLLAFAALGAHVEKTQLVVIRYRWRPLRPRAAARHVERWGARGWQLRTRPELGQGLIRLQVSVGAWGVPLRDVLECFRQFNEGSWFIHAPSYPWARRRGSVVSTGEVGGLLVPPTAWCRTSNIEVSGGRVPDPPAQLPAWNRDRSEVLPIGRVRLPSGRELIAGWEAEGLLFGLTTGASGSGKSTRWMAMLLHVALARREGALFMEPSTDGIRDLLGYLSSAAERLTTIVLTGNRADLRVLGWNPIAAGSEDMAEIMVGNVVDTFATVSRWQAGANQRAINLTRYAVRSLTEIGLQVPPADCPTIFEIPRIVGDDSWRAAVLPHLSPSIRDYWTNIFPKEAKEAGPVVMRLVQELESSAGTVTLFGQSESTYDVARCMAEGRVVLICPKVESSLGTAVTTSLLASSALRAGLNRHRIPPEERNTFWMFLDELQTVPPALVKEAVEQIRKFQVRILGATLNPLSIAPATWMALANNCTFLQTGGLEWDGAVRFARQLPDVSPGAITDLPMHTAIFRARRDGKWCRPFKITTARLPELFGPPSATPAVTGGKTYAEVRADLDTLPRRVLKALGASHEDVPLRSRTPRSANVVSIADRKEADHG
jgi:hypothetical protein